MKDTVYLDTNAPFYAKAEAFAENCEHLNQLRLRQIKVTGELVASVIHSKLLKQDVTEPAPGLILFNEEVLVQLRKAFRGVAQPDYINRVSGLVDDGEGNPMTWRNLLIRRGQLTIIDAEHFSFTLPGKYAHLGPVTLGVAFTRALIAYLVPRLLRDGAAYFLPWSRLLQLNSWELPPTELPKEKHESVSTAAPADPAAAVCDLGPEGGRDPAPGVV
jgi:hypothetical protein